MGILKNIHIYSDESRHKNERFLLLGGIWVEEAATAEINNILTVLRVKYGYTNDAGARVNFLGEFKWTKVSDRYLHIYKEIIDIFFNCIKDKGMRSCVMLVDTKDPTVISYSNIKREGYFKLLYQLYFHNSKVPGIYKIYPDRITNPEQHNVNFAVLEECLESALRKKFSEIMNPGETALIKRFVHQLIPIDSKSSEFIQLLDVVMGAIGYYQNRLFEKENARKAKIELMKYVFDKLLYSGIVQISGKQYLVAKSTRFNIWLFRPKK
jgi:hypothetical protein